MKNTRSNRKIRSTQVLLTAGVVTACLVAIAPAEADGTGTVVGTKVCGTTDEVKLVGSGLSDGNASDYQLFSAVWEGGSGGGPGGTTNNVTVHNGAFSGVVKFPIAVVVGHDYSWGLSSVNAMADDGGEYVLKAGACTASASLRLSPTTVARGRTETVTLKGFKADEMVRISISGRAAALGKAKVGSHGTGTFRFKVASSTVIGRHTVNARGLTSHRVASRALTVTR